MKIKLSKKDKKNIEKELAKQIKTDGKVVEALKKNNGKLKKLGMKIKATTWIDPETKEKHFGGCVELLESKSEYSALNGINLDLGATNDLNVLLGVSKDFDVASVTEFSVGGYIDVLDTSKQLYNKLFKDSKEDLDIKVKIGLSKAI